MTIFRKLVLAGFVAVFGLLALAIYSVNTIQHLLVIQTSVEDFGVIEGMADSFGVDIATYVIEKDPKYIEDFNAHSDKAKKATKHLDETLAYEKIDIDTQPILAAISKIEADFLTIQNLVKEIGYSEEQGLRGELRAAIRAAEGLVTPLGDYNLTSQILMLRRHEKDFLLRFDQKYVQRFQQAVAETKAYVDSSPRYSDPLKVELKSLLDLYNEKFIDLTEAYSTLGKDLHTGLLGELTKAEKGLLKTAVELDNQFIIAVEQRTDELRRNSLLISLLFLAVVGGFIGAIIFNIRQRQSLINGSLQTYVEALEQDRFDYNSRLKVGGRDELADISESINAFLSKLQSVMAEQQELLAVSNRNRMALDVADTPVMLADADLNILYINQSAERMMAKRGEQMKTALPTLDPDHLIGANVDQFHKSPGHQRQLLETLKDVYRSEISVAGLTFGLTASPLFDHDGKRLGTVVEWEDRTERLAKEEAEQRAAEENARIRQALDNVSTNTMIADNDRNIVYMNAAIQKMLSKREAEIRKILPDFQVSSLLGHSIDRFHKNPKHQSTILSSFTSTHAANIQVGPLHFGLIANPVFDEQGERIGSVVEWQDKTLEVAIQQRVDDLIQAATHGDLTKRIELEDVEGFFLTLCEGLNNLVTICEGVVGDTARVFGALSHGDLSQTITKEYHGSFEQLKRDANATVTKLTDIMSQIRNSADTVTSGAEEIAQGNADLSQRTEQQASSLEETAASMEEMTAAVRNSAKNAQEANGIAQQTEVLAKQGGSVVTSTVEAMAEINDSSKKISEIIGVIDEIAFQTNLLALNAAVEAARAGEQGRGFAVVASEVRSLAQRSAAAAREIKDLIRDSVEKVESGSELVNRSGEVLEDIVQSVARVSTMVEGISNSATEQSSGIEQVNRAVTQMDEMTQQNAALVEEASAAGETMAEQARKLGHLVSFFSLAGTQTEGVDAGVHATPDEGEWESL